MVTLSTSNNQDITPFVTRIPTPQRMSHKGQNGRVMVIGGSKLFHAAALWSAEIASHLVDMVHFASTEQNNEIMTRLKTQFRQGIVVARSDIDAYIQEDDTILIGPGMVRNPHHSPAQTPQCHNLTEVLEIENEGTMTAALTRYVLTQHPEKKYVIDAGALQMIDPDWLLSLTQPAILTPHQGEFARTFGISVEHMTLEQKAEMAQKVALKYHCVILLKAVSDIITDGHDTFVVEGGNAGLAKGGTGDILAGTVASLYVKTDAVPAAVVGSWMLKQASEVLYNTSGYWYNNCEIIAQMPRILHGISAKSKVQ